jgi:hypothetical protein
MTGDPTFTSIANGISSFITARFGGEVATKGFALRIRAKAGELLAEIRMVDE